MNNYKEKFSLQGKRAVVTGGAGLLGKEVVAALAQAGAQVVIADIDEQRSQSLIKELRDDSLSVDYFMFDVTVLEDLEANVKKLSEHLAGIDIWVNSAYPKRKDFGCSVEELSVETWRENIDVQLNSYALLSKYAAEQMKRSGGSIINFSSIYGVVGNDPGLYENTKYNLSMSYPTIKGGIISLGRFLAAYYGKYNIRVNTVCPGGVFDNQDPVFVEAYSKRTPLKRMASSQDVAPVVVFLAADAASYITGSTIMVDGGWTCI